MTMITRIIDYTWTDAGGLPDIEYSAFSTFTSRTIYADVIKGEQRMANTNQQRRLVALVDGDNVVEYTIIEPNPASVDRSV